MLLEMTSHFLLAVCFALCFFVARLLLDTFIFKPLAGVLLLRCGGSMNMINDDARRSKIVKCSESMWKLTYYVSMQLWVALIMLQDYWWLNTKEYFREWAGGEIDSSLEIFFTCQYGFYLYSIVALVKWETRRKDFPIMMSHHIITSVSMELTFHIRLLRLGTITLALHDTSDVFLEAAKIFKYLEMETGALICFGLFAISWLILRLIVFPFWIIKAFSYDSRLVVDDFPMSMYYTGSTLLITLLIFHIYWWRLICIVIWKQIGNEGKGKVEKDIRSDDEDEDDDQSQVLSTGVVI
ncbi:uncharacterized protein A4U43_C02F3950 [Asparagus officinalis]|uniref:TLC domain-containing protein n=1 Tax=Asparagus officinalis TaxID=4686 RepID=A0A5P1FHI5_ASPOF|nr:ASC1-like protein 3 [Asparagus officinalis]ONK77183.1 uncharacterized protein A4U43_C02F3950 [Asparagus officinalis]